jgi:predicted phosphodiesterase
VISLYVGDPHVKVSNLEESEALLQFVLKSAVDNKVDRIVLLGDLLHTHAVIRLEVLLFWKKWLIKLSSLEISIVALVGNHDQTGDYGSSAHALEVFKDLQVKNLTIVDQPYLVGTMAFLPYIHHEEKFLEAANALAAHGAKTLVCHQTFSGSKFDNGMYAPDGFDPDKLNFELIISGHIHSQQRFGKVIYPGTATWQTTSDANKEKGLWLVDHAEDGSIVSDRYLDTSTVVQPIYEISWKQGDEKPEIPTGRVSIELIGTSNWINQEKTQFKGKISFKSKITDKAQARVRQSGTSLADFTTSIFVTTFSKEELLAAMKEYELV